MKSLFEKFTKQLSRYHVKKSEKLVAALCNASAYDHAVNDISVIETHISWVILTGEYAYKIKKPIKYSFVDFSTLEKRAFYCNEELRLNGRLAPNLYLAVVSITGSPEYPSLDKSGEVIEYAVQMRQFPQMSLLSYLSVHDQLLQQHIDDIAKEVANFHIHIKKAPSNEVLGSPEDIHHWVIDNITQIESNLVDKQSVASIEVIKNWTESEYHEKYGQIQQRRNGEFIRECHGDMHLDNMVLIEGKVIIFDGIDFNKHLRWIDVISEIAFVAMDLSNRGHPKYANRLINLYLQYTGDYEGLGLLKYYLTYRAMVRAKVALLRIAQKNIPEIEKGEMLKEFRSYMALASGYALDQKIALIITHGLSGSGKSTHTEELLEFLGAIRIRSDVERKRLYGYSSFENTQSNLNEDIYSPQSSKDAYRRLAELSRLILNSGFTVIVDACFLQHELRHEFYLLADELQVSFIILDFQASEEVLEQRILNRVEDKNEPSEAGIEVLRSQLNKYVQLDEQEVNYAIVVDTENEVHIDAIAKAIQKRAQEACI